jgi:hypothetical protein
MSVRENLRPRLLLSDSPTLRVSLLLNVYCKSLTLSIDANLFKEAFIKAQQENEALFGTA